MKLFLDDEVITGRRSDVQRALSLIDELGSTLGICINLPKCELFSRKDTSGFPTSMKSCHLPSMNIPGAPISDYLHFTAGKLDEAKKLLSPIRRGCSS